MNICQKKRIFPLYIYIYNVKFSLLWWWRGQVWRLSDIFHSSVYRNVWPWSIQLDIKDKLFFRRLRYLYHLRSRILRWLILQIRVYVWFSFWWCKLSSSFFFYLHQVQRSCIRWHLRSIIIIRFQRRKERDLQKQVWCDPCPYLIVRKVLISIKQRFILRIIGRQ